MKKKGIKQGLRPKLRFSEFQCIGEWQKRRLKEFLKESRIPGSFGDVAKKITVKLWGKGVFEKEEAMKGSRNTKYFRRKAGQFIYSKLDFLNQAFGIVPGHLDGFESTIDLPCFDVSKNLNPIFLLEYVKREAFYKKFGEIADGGRKAKRIQVEAFLSFPIMLPPVPSKHAKSVEQQKIADCLSSVDDLIVTLTQKIVALKDHKKGLIKLLFPVEGESLPKLRFPEFQDASEWGVKLLGEICDIKGGKRIPKGFSLTTENTGYPYIRVSDMFTGGVDVSSVLYISGQVEKQIKKYKISKNDLFISVAGTVGIVGEIPEELDNANLTENANKIIIKDVIKKYLLQYLIGNAAQKKISSSITNNAQPKLALERIKLFCVPLPPKQEQKKIADCLSSVDELIVTQIQKLDTLKKYKNGLIQQLFPVINEACE